MRTNRVVLVLTILGLVGLIAPSAHAKVKKATLTEIIDRSERIALVEVKEAKLWKQTGNLIHMKNLLTVLKVLKWKGEALKEIEVVTRHRDPAEGRREDPSTRMPPNGAKVMVFLYKHEDGYWTPTSRFDGLWKVGENGFENPYRPTLEELEKAIKSTKAPDGG